MIRVVIRLQAGFRERLPGLVKVSDIWGALNLSPPTSDHLVDRAIWTFNYGSDHDEKAALEDIRESLPPVIWAATLDIDVPRAGVSALTYKTPQSQARANSRRVWTFPVPLRLAGSVPADPTNRVFTEADNWGPFLDDLDPS